ncbi:MAG TPA: hypothetical protein VHX44_05250 [Planctomycetota bacterium]|nr:hypothetical protein [Planctomycetota bacterium]
MSALLISTLLVSHLAAVEVTLQLPDLLVAGVVLRGGIMVENGSARIDHIDLLVVLGLE